MKEALNGQQKHWRKTYSEEEFFGEEPSYSAQKTLKIFKKEGKTKILEKRKPVLKGK